MDAITVKDEAEIRAVLAKIFSPHQAATWRINQKTIEIIADMLSEAKKCSSRMSFVPRPGFPINPANYFKKEFRGIMTRYILSKDGDYYVSCIRVVSRNYVRLIDLASSEID